MKNEATKLTDKQKRFCEEYMIDFNGTQAAIRAGYSKKTANEQAAQNLAKLNIQEYIKEKQQKVANRLEITQERVLQEYARIAFFDVRRLFGESGELLPIDKIDDDTAAAVGGIESLDEFEGYGEDRKCIGQLRKIKITDKKGALDSICKVLGFNAPVKQEVTIEQPLTPEQRLARINELQAKLSSTNLLSNNK